MTAPLRTKRQTSKMIVYGILGLLALSLTGFGVRSIGHGGTQAVATVGSEKVTVDSYAQALRAQLQALSRQLHQNITLEQARAFGLDRQVLSQVVASAALDGESARLGISIGDARVRDKVVANRAFQGLTGKFDKTTYTEALHRANLKPAQYETILRKESARGLLQTGVVGGVKPDDTYALTLLKYVGETRDFSWASVTADMLPSPTRAPSDAEIKKQYKDNPKTYTSPETRKITYVRLTPKMLLPTLKVDEKALHDLYQSLSDKYHIPARVSVDRLVFPTKAEAKAAIDSIRSGKRKFKDVVRARGFALKDTALGTVAASDLSDAAAKAVFALKEPGIVGPVQSDLGPAIYRVNAILAAKNTTFATARPDLVTQLLGEKARNELDNRIGKIDDMLAGGATLEEVTAETSMKLANIDYVKGKETGLTASPAFRKAAESAKPADFPEVTTTADGSIFALRLNKVVAPALIPLDKVRARVIADWTRAETHRRIVKLAKTKKAALAAGKTFADLGLSAEPKAGIRRDAAIKGAPADLVRAVFKLAENEATVVAGPEKVALAQLGAIHPFNASSPENKKLIANVNARYGRDVGTDMFQAYARAVEDKAGVTVNQALISAVQAQIP